MRALPTSDWTGEPGYAPPLAGEWKRLARPVSHVFTHFALNLHVEWRHVERACMTDPAGEWWRIEDIGEAGLPTLFAKAARSVLEEIAGWKPFRSEERRGGTEGGSRCNSRGTP